MRKRLNKRELQMLHMVAVANAHQQPSPSIREMMVVTGRAMGAVTGSIKRLTRLQYFTRPLKGKARTLRIHPLRVAYLTKKGEPTQQYYQVW